jgi:hypothetical protein
LQSRGSASKINFCNWFLQSVHGNEVDPHFAFSSDETHTIDDSLMALEGVLVTE